MLDSDWGLWVICFCKDDLLLLLLLACADSAAG